MNRSDKPASSDYSVETRTFRKTRRKRKRTKVKAISTAKLSKKCQKKLYSTAVTTVNSSFECSPLKKRKKNKHNAPDVEIDRNKIMSSWYWSNYNKTLVWRNKHKVAYWKAYALALQQENQYLLQIIQNLDPGNVVKTTNTSVILEDQIVNPIPKSAFKSEESVNSSTSSMSDNNVCEDDELAFELSEEMMKFFEQSFKHKIDLKKTKEAEKISDEDAFLKEAQKLRVQREEEMKLLYGDGASMIVGMETAVQLSYDRYCDTKSPKYWPNIPLKL